MSGVNQIYYPNVTQIPSKTGIEGGSTQGEGAIKKGEFDQSLEQAMKQNSLSEKREIVNPSTLQNVNPQGIKFSAHAMQRLRERKIQFEPEMMAKMNEAINKADSKGVQDTLVLTEKAALIVSVPSRTVITAMDRNNLSGNVFTNIDGAVII